MGLRFLRGILLTGFLFLTLPAFSAGETPPQLIRSFFDRVVHRDYAGAYAFLSQGLRDEVSFEEFRQEALQAEKVKLGTLRWARREAAYARLLLTGSVLWRQDSRLVWVLYEGKADFIKEKGRWRVLAVDFEPVSRKAVVPKKAGSLRLRHP